jgi:hypothetical protein
MNGLTSDSSGAPHARIRSRAVCLVSAVALFLLVRPVASNAQTLRLSDPPPLVGLSALSQAAPTVPANEWQRQFDEATRNRSAGKKKMLYGAAAFVGGIVIVGASAGDGLHSGSTGGIVLGNFVMLGGVGTSVWGFVQWNHAVGKLDALELQRTSKQVTLLELDGHQAVTLSASRSTTLNYRVSW